MGSFVFAGRSYMFKLLADDALIYGLDLTPPCKILVKRDDVWQRPGGDPPTALGRTALKAYEDSL